MTEIDKINNAIDDFAQAMKDRMHIKYEKGYAGWDGEYPTEILLTEIIDDTENIKENIPIIAFKTTCTSILRRKAVDVGARAMMLWYRHKL